MPMVVCPNCGNKVTFQGIAGVCPNCASVVTVPKPVDDSAKKMPAAPRPLSKTPVKVSDIEAVGGEHQEVFEPAATPKAGDGQLDKGVIITMVGAGVVVLVFAMFVLFGGPSKTPPPAPPAPAPVAQAPAPTPQPIAPMPEPIVSAPAVPTTHAVLSTGPSWAHLKPQRPPASANNGSTTGSGVTDAAVNQSVTRGADWLVKQFLNGEIVDRSAIPSEMYSGVHALSTYALLHCGTAITDQRLNIADPFMQSTLEHLKLLSMDTPNATYSHSLRAAALSLFNRRQDGEVLKKDLEYLMQAEKGGHYTYVLPPKEARPDDVTWDNSNSQYGVLGVWAATQAGSSVRPEYWHDVEMHWTKTQRDDGGWPYSAGAVSTITMTAAGVTTLSVAAEQENISNSGQVAGHAQLTNAIGRGLEWLDSEDHILQVAGNGYALYSIERAALATGLKRFGSHDWYRELAAGILTAQNRDGSWGGGTYPPQVETAFRLLFLARGRQALVINKLRFNGEWNNRPRDASKLAEYASMQLEQPFAWGVADFNRDWSEWIDCPLMLISTDTPPGWTDADFAKLRKYTDAGGMILLHNETAAPEMNDFAATLAKQAFPEFPLVDLPPDNMIYSVVYPMQKKPPLKAVSNGHRMLMVYAPTDVTKQWLLRRGKETNPGSQLGINLFVYAAGKTNFHGRLITPYLPPPLFAAIGTIPIARVQYPGGNADPEPAAWQRFPRWFQGETSLALTVAPTPIDELKFPDVPVAVITGAGAVDFDKINTQPLHDFVAKGGIVVIDSVAGDEAFAKSVREKLLPKAFADGQIQPLDRSHPLLGGTGDGMDPLPKPQLRAFTMETRKEGGVPMLDLITLGKGAVIISDIDLTCGLLNTTTWGISGYEPSYCNSLMKNVILWASARYHL